MLQKGGVQDSLEWVGLTMKRWTPVNIECKLDEAASTDAQKPLIRYSQVRMQLKIQKSSLTKKGAGRVPDTPPTPSLRALPELISSMLWTYTRPARLHPPYPCTVIMKHSRVSQCPSHCLMSAITNPYAAEAKLPLHISQLQHQSWTMLDWRAYYHLRFDGLLLYISCQVYFNYSSHTYDLSTTGQSSMCDILIRTCLWLHIHTYPFQTLPSQSSEMESLYHVYWRSRRNNPPLLIITPSSRYLQYMKHPNHFATVIYIWHSRCNHICD